MTSETSEEKKPRGKKAHKQARRPIRQKEGESRFRTSSNGNASPTAAAGHDRHIEKNQDRGVRKTKAGRRRREVNKVRL